MTLKEKLEHYQIVAQILALVAVPILVAFFGWQIQEGQREREMQKDFVQMAVSVLSAETKQGDGPAELKAWASRLLANTSPVPFKDDEFRALLVSENAKTLRVAIACETPDVAVPKWAADSLSDSDTLEVKIRALLAERRQRIGYERELITAMRACRY